MFSSGKPTTEEAGEVDNANKRSGKKNKEGVKKKAMKICFVSKFPNQFCEQRNIPHTKEQ